MRSLRRGPAPGLLLLLLLAACSRDSASTFRDITAASGVTFNHTVEHLDTFPLPEILGGGCAVFDADGDGRFDLYFTDAGRVGGKGAANRLFLRGPDGTYRDATAESGLGDEGYGMGVAVGDIDNDGDLDVYVGNDGADALYRNDGGGKFTNITAAAGIDDREWTSSIAFLDYDVDGWLDVFVVHYVTYDPAQFCPGWDGGRDYCSPKVFKGVADRLWRNRGDGTFEDVSAKAGIASVASNGLGVIVEDFDDDGWPDVFVANDAQANHLWRNNRDGTFREEGLPMGVAVNAQGAPEGSMGVAAGDVEADGDFDLFVTNLYKEGNALYLRESYGFADESQRCGLAAASFAFTGFGTVMADFDHDGDLDIAVANGRVMQATPEPAAALDPLWNRYAERNQLFVNDGRGQFTETTRDPFCTPVEVSRGLAAGDLDADGDLDLVVVNCKGKARIYENAAVHSGHWLQVRAVDAGLRRDVYGAVVLVHAGSRVHRRTIGPGSSYLSSSQIAAHFGLGASTSVERIEVRWPGGERETFAGGAVDRAITLTRGSGSK